MNGLLKAISFEQLFAKFKWNLTVCSGSKSSPTELVTNRYTREAMN